jgi:hypothetical protein
MLHKILLKTIVNMMITEVSLPMKGLLERWCPRLWLDQLALELSLLTMEEVTTPLCGLEGAIAPASLLQCRHPSFGVSAWQRHWGDLGELSSSIPVQLKNYVNWTSLRGAWILWTLNLIPTSVLVVRIQVEVRYYLIKCPTIIILLLRFSLVNLSHIVRISWNIEIVYDGTVAPSWLTQLPKC